MNIKSGYIIYFLIFIVVQHAQSQIIFGVNKNIDIYKPYTPEAQAYLKINNKVESSTFGYYLQAKMLEKKRFSWFVGVSYKNIIHEVDNKILTYYTYTYGNGQTSQTTTHKNDNPLDLNSKSESFALSNEISWQFPPAKRYKNEFGLRNEFYFLEFFKSAYYYHGTDNEFFENTISLSPLVTELPSPLLLSSVNISTFYRFVYNLDENFTIATKVSLGTNLYSDWDQFKKYAWLGVGLELGFGKKPLFKKKAS